MIVSISRNSIDTKNLAMLIDFKETHLPRLLPLHNLLAVNNKTDELVKAVFENGLGLTSNKNTAREETEEFIALIAHTDADQFYTPSETWKRVPLRCVKNRSDFYTHKNKNCTTRRLILKGNYNSNGYTCIIQYKADRIADSLLIDPSLVSKAIEARYKKEVLVRPQSCAMLHQQALGQNKVLQETTARLLESEILHNSGLDRVAVIEGEWNAYNLFDGEDWKNNSVTWQKELIDDNKELKKITTFIPRDRSSNPEKTGPLPKKEHVTCKNYTLLYYHTKTDTTKKKKNIPKKPTVVEKDLVPEEPVFSKPNTNNDHIELIEID